MEFAKDDLGNTETNLFSNINLKGSGFPDVIQVVITDFKEGDVLRINNDDVDQSFDTGSGILTLSNPLGADNSSKITSFQNALNNVLYSSSNDNPDFQLMDVERSTDPQRLIEIRVLDNQGTGDINEARTVAKIKVDITSVDDKPVLLVNNFNRVQLVQKTVTEIVDDEEVEVTGLRVESTQLLPVSLLDQPGVNAFIKLFFWSVFRRHDF